ncbi:MAG: sulfur carrier protein ThiS [Phycisphaerae bacterium]|nr:sulfur carrier protein ThiS [Phycisphaerae bacterium]
MQITVNGETRTVDERLTVADLLARLRHERTDSRPGGSPLDACAVEVNRALVPRRRHAEHALADGDTVEIVTLVGGG